VCLPRTLTLCSFAFLPFVSRLAAGRFFFDQRMLRFVTKKRGEVIERAIDYPKDVRSD